MEIDSGKSKSLVTKTKKERAKRCNECSHCTRDNCGVCSRCLDMVSFGGTGKLKKGCLERICIYMEVAVRTRL